MVACSPGVLVSVVTNLLGNAVKYMGDAPIKRVTVRSTIARTVARVEVSDTGPGVPRELRERIFDPYVRATNPSIPGMGLGLATVRRLIESHGGSVGMEPNGGIGGSVFWFELPLFSEDRAGAHPAGVGALHERHAADAWGFGWRRRRGAAR
jgi:signal transduction histidine kinase